MDYILGAGLLFAAVLTIALGRLVLNRSDKPVDDDTFGAAESIAFVFTVILTVGIAFMARKAIADDSLLSLLEMAAALGATAIASVAAWIGLARRTTRAPAALVDTVPGDTGAPGRGRPHRPTGTGAQGGRKPQAKRAA